MAKTPEERKEYLRLYHLKNKAKAKVQMKAWHEAHPEHNSERRQRYAEGDKSAAQAAGRAYHHANRDRELARMKERVLQRTRSEKDELNAKSRELYAATLDQQHERSAAYYEANRDAVLEKSAKYYRANTAQARAKCSERWGRVKLATPLWADFNQMNSMYDLARSLSELTGVPHEVDHIVPIQHKLVCGLHAHTNLQVITATENRKKLNRFEVS